MIEFVDVKKLYKSGDKPAVNGVSLTFEKGEITVLVGPSGCGKTTMLKMINRIVDPTEGEILLDSQPINELNPLHLRRNIGYVIQHVGLFPHLTIEDNVATVLRLNKWPKAKIEKRIAEMLDLVGIPVSFRKRLPDELSGGQQQRVGVARALAADPPVMLMDEPFGALDPITRDHLQNEFLKIQDMIKKTIVFVTHDIEEAFKMGDSIVVMREGNVVQFDTPLNILSNPADEFVSNLTGSDRGVRYLNLVPTEDLMEPLPAEEISGPDLEVMSHEIRVLPENSLKDAFNKMVEYGMPVLPVANADGQVIGQVTVNSIVQGIIKNNHEVNNINT